MVWTFIFALPPIIVQKQYIITSSQLYIIVYRYVVYGLPVHCNVVSVSVVQLVIGESCHIVAVCILCRRWRKPS